MFEVQDRMATTRKLRSRPDQKCDLPPGQMELTGDAAAIVAPSGVGSDIDGSATLFGQAFG
jgi:hypothetical protein